MTTYAVVGGFIIVLLFLAWLGIRIVEGKGRAEAEKNRYQEMAEQARKANEIDEAIAGLSDDDLDRELFER